jgi:two-component system, chemotaxis family, protein-glutamate methylesterase/glutaminase
MTTDKSYEAVVIGVSAGGLHALGTILPLLPADFDLAVMVVQHRAKESNTFLHNFLDELCLLRVVEAEEKMVIQAGYIYLAPPDYHLQIEMDRNLSLSVDPPVNWSRPSVDVLFETAAEVYRDKLVGVVLTGANNDGSMGLTRVKQLGGLSVIQDPKTAEAAQMPQGAIDAVGGDHILSLVDIGLFLATLKNQKSDPPLI